jgi:Transposase DDE domain
LREMLDSLQEGDILLGDSFYATYFLLWELIGGGVDGLFEQQGARQRSTDFSQGERLGVRDHLIVLAKPKKPDWMRQYEYDQVPETVKVRELQAGGKILVTTFVCPKQTPKHLLKALYRCRWNIELDLRNIKTTLGMEQLRCKTPEMAIKELWVYLLAYNLIRLLMAQAALLADRIPRQLSFKHTVQIWLAWQQRGGGTHDGVSIHALLILIAEPRVGLRPGRIEPRTLKRRPKPFPLLTQPRQFAREEVREHGHPKKQR